MLNERKKVRRDREDEKVKHSYHGKGQVENRVKAEAEQDFLDSPTEKEMQQNLTKNLQNKSSFQMQHCNFFLNKYLPKAH